MQHKKAICCISTQDYLPKLIALYQSILKYQDISLYLMAVDVNPDETAVLSEKLNGFLPKDTEGKLHVIAPEDIYGKFTIQMRFYYDAFEFSNACKAGLHSWIQKNTSIDRWLFIDGDMLCFGSLEPIFNTLNENNILLSPHLNKPSGSFSTDVQMLSAGAFNGGLLGLKRSDISQAFCNWYLRILTFYCLNDPPLAPQDRFIKSTVIFGDQRWLDLVPAYFPGVIVAQERGFNLGHWNMRNDHLNWQNTALHIGNDLVSLFHLSGWSTSQPTRVSRYSSLDWTGNPVWIGISQSYKESLDPLNESFNIPYRFNTYSDKSVIPKSHRRRYLQYLLSGSPAHENPFMMRNKIEHGIESNTTQKY